MPWRLIWLLLHLYASQHYTGTTLLEYIAPTALRRAYPPVHVVLRPALCLAEELELAHSVFEQSGLLARDVVDVEELIAERVSGVSVVNTRAPGAEGASGIKS
jgi:hypothetical protein